MYDIIGDERFLELRGAVSSEEWERVFAWLHSLAADPVGTATIDRRPKTSSDGVTAHAAAIPGTPILVSYAVLEDASLIYIEDVAIE